MKYYRKQSQIVETHSTLILEDFQTSIVEKCSIGY